LIPEQEKILEQKTMDQVCKILDKNYIDTSWLSLKSWVIGDNIVDPEKKNKKYLD
jgi:hypothetical protein